MGVSRSSFEGVAVTPLAPVLGNAGPIGNLVIAAQAPSPEISQQGPANAPELRRV